MISIHLKRHENREIIRDPSRKALFVCEVLLSLICKIRLADVADSAERI